MNSVNLTLFDLALGLWIAAWFGLLITMLLKDKKIPLWLYAISYLAVSSPLCWFLNPAGRNFWVGLGSVLMPFGLILLVVSVCGFYDDLKAREDDPEKNIIRPYRSVPRV